MVVLSMFECVEKLVGKKATAKLAMLVIKRLPSQEVFTGLAESAIEYLCAVRRYPTCRQCFLPIIDDTPSPIPFHDTCLRARLVEDEADQELKEAHDAEVKVQTELDLARAAESDSWQTLVAHEAEAQKEQEANDASRYDEEDFLREDRDVQSSTTSTQKEN